MADIHNKEECYSRVLRLSDTRYSAKRDQREMDICEQQSEIVEGNKI